MNLRQVMQTSAHWLLLMDKKKYSYDESKPLLLMVTFTSLRHKSPFSNAANVAGVIYVVNVSSDLTFRTT